MTRAATPARRIKALGDLDEEAGEFWVENPFMMMGVRANLSGSDRIDRLQVWWPSGELQELKDLPGDRPLKIVEGKEEFRVAG